MALQATRTPTRRESNGPFVVRLWDDFFGFNGSTTTGLADYQITETNGSSTQLISATLSGGVLVLTDQGTEDNVIDISSNAGVKISDCLPGSWIRFQARFYTDDADQMDIHLGLNIKDPSMVAGASADHIMFRSSDASAALDLQISKDSVVTAVTDFATLVDGAMTHVEFAYKVPSSGDTDLGPVYYKVISNGTIAEGSVPAAGNFPDDVVLFLDLQAQLGEGAANVTALDYWELEFTLASLAGTAG